jgi:hypothetical protein
MTLQVRADRYPQIMNSVIQQFRFGDPANIVFAKDGGLEHTWRV